MSDESNATPGWMGVALILLSWFLAWSIIEIRDDHKAQLDLLDKRISALRDDALKHRTP